MKNSDLITSTMHRYLVIDLLIMERGKSYGFQEYMFNLLNYFQEHRSNLLFKSIIILCKKGEESLFNNYPDFEIYAYPYSNYFKRLWIQSLVPIKMKLNSSDVLLSPVNYSGLIKCCPTVLVIHDLLYKRRKLLKNRLMRLQREIYVPLSIQRADRVVAISQSTADDIRYYYPQAIPKLRVVHNYLNFGKFGTSPSAIVGNYILGVSSNQYHKNLKTIIIAYDKYVKQGGWLPFVLLGSIDLKSPAGNAFSSLSESVRKRIIFRSGITNQELGCLYRDAAFYVSASLFEGFGMPIVEAMYFNLPVLLPDSPVFHEVSLERGTYFDPNNSDLLAIKLLNMDIKKKSYSDEVLKFYSESETSARYINIVNNPTGGGNLLPLCSPEKLRRAA